MLEHVGRYRFLYNGASEIFQDFKAGYDTTVVCCIPRDEIIAVMQEPTKDLSSKLEMTILKMLERLFL